MPYCGLPAAAPPVSPESPPQPQRPPQVVYPGTRRGCPYGCGGHRRMLSVKRLFSVACPPSSCPFVAFCRWSVSDPFPYPSCPCLPLCTSSSRCPSGSRREGAAVSSVLSLRTFTNIPGWRTFRVTRADRREGARWSSLVASG